MIPKNWLWLLSALLVGGTAAAQSRKVCDPDDPKSCLQTLVRGQAAPFDGQLLSKRRVAVTVAKITQCADRQAAEVARATGVLRAEINGMQLKLDLRDQFHKQETDLLLGRMKTIIEDYRPKWYEHPVFVASAAVAATTVLFLGAVKALDTTTK